MDQELWDRVKKNEATKSSWRNKFDSQQYKDASKLNKILTGKPLNKQVGCECVEDLYFVMKRNNYKQTITEMADKQFHLKEGKVIMLHGCTPVTSKSSDKELMALLKKYPSQIVKFTRYPANWRELLELDTLAKKGKAGGAPKADAPVTDAPVTDAPVTDAPVTDAPVTDAPVTDAPVTDAPVTDAPVTDAPVTDAPVTDGADGNLSAREEELLTLPNDALKKILENDLLLPLPEKINKVNLVNAILEAEKK